MSSTATQKPTYSVFNADGTLHSQRSRKDAAVALASTLGTGATVASPSGTVVHTVELLDGEFSQLLVDDYLRDVDAFLATVAKAKPKATRKPAPRPTVSITPEASNGGRFQKKVYGATAATGYAQLASTTLRAQLGITWKVLREDLQVKTEAQALEMLQALANGSLDATALLGAGEEAPVAVAAVAKPKK